LKKITGKTYVERVVIKAIQNNIAIYAIHTNLDNVLLNGVNSKIADKLGLSNTEVLAPKQGQFKKFVMFAPKSNAAKIRKAIGEAGAGKIGNYDFCSFESDGTGRFRGNDNSNPTVGTANELHEEAEVKIEAIVPAYAVARVVSAAIEQHIYEEPAYDIIPLDNFSKDIGAGIIGNLPTEMSYSDFLAKLKSDMNLDVIRHTSGANKQVSRVAICGGSGSFLLKTAMARNADVFVTGDFKYHEFFDGEEKTQICDIGHYESEQYTIELLGGIINKKFRNFAVLFTECFTNPINYYY
jgi:dinuclear metal center YbgI/SA1388 family protein